MENMNVAYCGLYCGSCRKFKKGKCPGCYDNEKAAWCAIRKCCRDNNYKTCADCKIVSLKECMKFNNIFSKVIGFVTWTDRSKCIDQIKIVGIDTFAQTMNEKNRMSIKR